MPDHWEHHAVPPLLMRPSPLPLPVLTPEMRAKMYDPLENMRAAFRFLRARYADPLPWRAWEPGPTMTVEKWGPTRCLVCWYALDAEERAAMGTGTADDHFPCRARDGLDAMSAGMGV